LKRHYETYLLEYELAHDDVDGECCLLCHRFDGIFIQSVCFNTRIVMIESKTSFLCNSSSAPGDWVNCGLCGEWAHFGCDRRQGLGTFKVKKKRNSSSYPFLKSLALFDELLFFFSTGLREDRWIGIHLPPL
jgi:hypothetical protein